MTAPAANVFRHEVHANDFAGTYDSDHQNRRSELCSEGDDRAFDEGETVWSSFCFILGNTPGLGAHYGIVHQFHDVGSRSPVIGIDTGNDQLRVFTRSAASMLNDNGVPVWRYTGTKPVKGARTYVVLQATFGQTGHLNLWINGAQVVNDDCPLGYYGLESGMGYPLFGLYTPNQGTTEVVCHANIEWGTSSLASRITTPLPVPEFAIDTDNDMFPYTLPFTLAT